MSVLLETSKGDIIIDLHCEQCPIACKNFLKLCKLKYYNFCLFHNVQPGSIIQSGDPTGTGQGGDSLYRLLFGDQARFFEDEIHRKLRHAKAGTVSMANTGPNTNASQFFITTTDGQDHLDDQYTIFGEVAEGLDIVRAISEVYADGEGRPYQNIRIRHTLILDDPFDDPPGLVVPDASPEPSELVLKQDRERLADGESLEEDVDGRSAEEIERSLQDKAAKSRAEVLEMLGDLPDADMRPPENVLFICKLNPITEDEDLEIIFSRFGECKVDIIRDFKTGDSLNYGFVEFEQIDSATQAYFKMDGALVDDRRIKVDFCQSVASGKLWNARRRGEAMPGFDGGGKGGGGKGGKGGGGKGGGGKGGGGKGGGGKGAGGGRGSGGDAQPADKLGWELKGAAAGGGGSGPRSHGMVFAADEPRRRDEGERRERDRDRDRERDRDRDRDRDRRDRRDERDRDRDRRDGRDERDRDRDRRDRDRRDREGGR